MEQARAFDEAQEDAPTYYQGKYFFIRFGVDALRKVQKVRLLYVELVMYTIFSVLFIVYALNNKYRNVKTNHVKCLKGKVDVRYW